MAGPCPKLLLLLLLSLLSLDALSSSQGCCISWTAAKPNTVLTVM